MRILRAPLTLLDDRLVAGAWVAIEGDTIRAVGEGAPPEGSVEELAEGVLAPGLVDVQLNGAFGVDMVDADDLAWDRVLSLLPATGVTAVVPTFITAPVDDLAYALSAAAPRVRRDRIAPPRGQARAVGIHVEGPFLAANRRGAHDERHLTDPSGEAIGKLLDAGHDVISYVTLAPERTGAFEAIGTLTAADVRVSVGHSDATAEQVLAAIDAGASLVTHLYNAQRPFGHRDPGVVGVALTDPRLTAGMIVDLHHVHPVGVRLAFAAAPGRIMLVTDAISAMGMPEGTYDLAGSPTTVRDGLPPTRADGTLAGSDLRLDQAVANAIACGIAPAAALVAATRIPADAVGRPDLGRLAVGAPADLVWLGEDWLTRRTWIAGEAATAALPMEQP